MNEFPHCFNILGANFASFVLQSSQIHFQFQPNCLILEYVDGGDMLEYLQKNRENPNCTISQEDQVFFAWQIANGMVRLKSYWLYCRKYRFLSPVSCPYMG